MAARIIAQLVVIGGGVLIRACAQAYRQALATAIKVASFMALSTGWCQAIEELGDNISTKKCKRAGPGCNVLDQVSNGPINNFTILRLLKRNQLYLPLYSPLLSDASKTGAAREAVENTVRRGSRAITEQEARQILGVTENAAWEDILKKYDILFERNAKQGSFYLQSKVHRAKECLEAVYQNKPQGGSSG